MAWLGRTAGQQWPTVQHRKTRQQNMGRMTRSGWMGIVGRHQAIPWLHWVGDVGAVLRADESRVHHSMPPCLQAMGSVCCARMHCTCMQSIYMVFGWRWLGTSVLSAFTLSAVLDTALAWTWPCKTHSRRRRLMGMHSLCARFGGCEESCWPRREA